MECFVTADRNRDLCSHYYGKLLGFRFHRKEPGVDWFAGQVRVRFPSWGIAQKAVSQLRAGDASLWDAYVWGVL